MVRIMQYGSSKPVLQVESLSIFSLCVNDHIRIEPEWIAREQSELADYYSNLIDYDDWILNPAVFKYSLGGPCY